MQQVIILRLLFLFLPESTIKNDNPTPKAKALFDFDGEYEDELSVRVSVYCSVWSGIGRRDSPVVRVLGCGSRGPSASPGWADCLAQNLSLPYPGVLTGTGK